MQIAHVSIHICARKPAIDDDVKDKRKRFLGSLTCT